MRVQAAGLDESTGGERGGEEEGDKVAGYAVAGYRQRVVCEPLCFIREQAGVKHNIFMREVPSNAREYFDSDVSALEDKPARHKATDRVGEQLATVKPVPGIVSRYGLRYRCLAPRTGAGADKTLCWATVHLKGLPVPDTGDDALNKDEYLGRCQLVAEALQFELPNRFGQEDIDAKYTYLCNRGQNAVVTYKGARAQVAAALATQKQQMRM